MWGVGHVKRSMPLWWLLAKSHLPGSSVEKGKTPQSLLFTGGNGWKDVKQYSFTPLKDVQVAH